MRFQTNTLNILGSQSEMVKAFGVVLVNISLVYSGKKKKEKRKKEEANKSLGHHAHNS